MVIDDRPQPTYFMGQEVGQDKRMAPRMTNKLTAVKVNALRKAPGRHSDGGGLYLRVTDSDDAKGQRWVLRFTSPLTGKVREMGLGSAAAGGVSLARARELATEGRATVKAGRDPIEMAKAGDGERHAATFG